MRLVVQAATGFLYLLFGLTIQGASGQTRSAGSLSPGTAGFCTNAYRVFCGTVRQSIHREDWLFDEKDKYSTPIAKAAFEATFPGVAYSTTMEWKLREKEPIRFLRAVEDTMFSTIGYSRAEFDEMSQSLRQTLSDVVQKQAQWPKATRDQMAEDVGKVAIRLPSDYLADGAKKNPEAFQRARNSVSKDCGSSLFESNAFFSPDDMTFVLCPAWALELWIQLKSPAATKNALKTIIGHELAHRIDSGAFPEPYSELNRCYQSRLGAKADWSEEIVADTMAVQLLAEDFKARQARPEEILKALKDGFSPFCGDGDGHEHPSGEFRINAILAKDRGIRELLGCAPSPGCGLDGNPK